jgi:hypothetical protein
VQNILYDDKRETGMDDRIFAQTFEARCPFLGLTGDRATALGYPDNRNHCHRHDLDLPLTQAKQAGYCLTIKHETCDIFLQEQPPEKSPEKAPSWLKWFRWLTLILPLILIIITTLVWWLAPDTSIDQFIGAAALLQNTVVAEENAQPPLSQDIIVPKAIIQPTPFEPSIAIGAVNLQPIPTEIVDENSILTPSRENTSPDDRPLEKSMGGFLVHIYE